MTLAFLSHCTGLEVYVHVSQDTFLQKSLLVSHTCFKLLYFCVFLLFQMFPTPTSHSKMVYSASHLKTPGKPGAGSKPHDVQEVFKKKQVLYCLLTAQQCSDKEGVGGHWNLGDCCLAPYFCADFVIIRLPCKLTLRLIMGEWIFLPLGCLSSWVMYRVSLRYFPDYSLCRYETLK